MSMFCKNKIYGQWDSCKARVVAVRPINVTGPFKWQNYKPVLVTSLEQLYCKNNQTWVWLTEVNSTLYIFHALDIYLLYIIWTYYTYWQTIYMFYCCWYCALLRRIVVNLLDQLKAQLFTYITYIAPAFSGLQNTIFREHVMSSVKPVISRHTTDSWFHIQYAALVISSYKTYINLVPIDKTLKYD
jgi:hypothetical protein